jgi:hypothetical protein
MTSKCPNPWPKESTNALVIIDRNPGANSLVALRSSVRYIDFRGRARISCFLRQGAAPCPWRIRSSRHRRASSACTDHWKERHRKKGPEVQPRNRLASNVTVGEAIAMAYSSYPSMLEYQFAIHRRTIVRASAWCCPSCRPLIPNCYWWPACFNTITAEPPCCVEIREQHGSWRWIIAF